MNTIKAVLGPKMNAEEQASRSKPFLFTEDVSNKIEFYKHVTDEAQKVTKQNFVHLVPQPWYQPFLYYLTPQNLWQG